MPTGAPFPRPVNSPVESVRGDDAFTINLKTILIAIAVVAVSFLVSLKTMDWLAPRGGGAPVLVELPPLPPAPRSSRVMAPVAIALSAIRDAADRGTPKTFQARPTIRYRKCCKTPISAGPPRADRSRHPAARTCMTLTTPLTGTLNVTGSLSAKATGAVGDAHRRPARQRCRQEDRRHQHQEPQRQCRDQGQHRHHVAAEAGSRLAHRAQSRGTGESRRHRPQRGGREHQRAGASQAADRQNVADQIAIDAGADEERSRPRTERAGAMGKGLPLDSAAGRRRPPRRCRRCGSS